MVKEIQYLKKLYELTWKKSPSKLPFKNWYLSIFTQLSGKLEIVRPLKYIEYGKNIAEKRSIETTNWKKYPRKHGESFITKFYQDIFLPNRFGFDKRRAHYSALILNGDISRDEAINKIKKDKLNNIKESEADIQFFCTKLEISRDKFDEYMNLEKKFHNEFKSIKTTLVFRLFKNIKIKVSYLYF